MSFLSRFRKSVVPTSKPKVNTTSNGSSIFGGGSDRKRPSLRSSYREKVDDGDEQLRNYRKATKSFNEKSLKPRNSYHSFGHTDEDENRWRSSKSSNGTNKGEHTHATPPKTTTTTTTAGTLTKSSMRTPTLSRSDTFTLAEENQVQNGTYARHKKKDNTENGNGDNGYYNHYNGNDEHHKTDSTLTRSRGKRYTKMNWSDFDVFVSRALILIQFFCEINFCHFVFVCFAVNNSINRDVFEPLYKRPSKSSASRSSKSSIESFRLAEDFGATTPPTQTHRTFDGNTFRKSKAKPSTTTKMVSGNESFQPNSSIRSEKSSKPRPYLFGATFGRSSKHKVDNEKENHNANHSNGDGDRHSDDRYKTITVNNLRQSFRDSFIKSSKAAKGREHQPIWFIDVKGDDDDKKKSEPKRPIDRHDTFRVQKESAASPSNGLGRRETFRINGREYIPSSAANSLEHKRSPSVDSNHSSVRRSMGPIRVDILNSSVGSDRSGRMVPVGVTAPYSALNDVSDETRKYTKKYDYHSPRTDSRTRNRSNAYDSYGESTPYRSSQAYTSRKPTYSSSPEDLSHRPNGRRSATYSPNRRFAPDKTSRDSPDAHKLNGTTHSMPDNKIVSARKTFRDLNLNSERSPAARPQYRIGSFRSATDTKPTSNGRQYFGADEYDGVDRQPSSDTSNDFNRNDWMHQSWRNISSRPFEHDNTNQDPENRSFVPYYKYDDPHNDSPTNSRDSDPNYHNNLNNNNHNNRNRTTININYNYNLSPPKAAPRNTTALTNDYNNETILKRHTGIDDPASSPSTSITTLKTIKSKEKPSKNRSVNFPSVEYEVRLISPNYDTKPRRRDAWKSKPSNDWTFNKVHL